MKRKCYNLVFPFLFLSVLLFSNCTDNSLFGNAEISANSIRGTVKLGNNLKPDEVFIWLEALDINTRTDKNGQFTLNLPAANKQPGGGIDGIYDLYFYVANYQLESVKISILNGNVQFSKLSLTSEGELKQTVVLQEILNINSSISFRQESEDGVRTFLAAFTVKAYMEPIIVSSIFSVGEFSNDPEYMSGYLLDSDKKFIKFLKIENKGFKSVNIQVPTSGGNLKPVIFSIGPEELSPGEYEVIPYLVIQQKTLPAGLIKSIGVNVQNYSFGFLKIPMKLSNNKFQI